MIRKQIKLVVISSWVVALLYSGYFMLNNNLTITGIVSILGVWLERVNQGWFWVLPLSFLVLFMLRPIFLIPTWVMNVVAVIVFGPWKGYFLVLSAEQLSAASFYFVIKYLAGDKLKHRIFKMAKAVRLDIEETKDKNFFTVLALRLASFPFDFVTALCAMIQIPFFPFMLATLIVSIPWVGLFFLTFYSFQEGSFVNGLINSVIFVVFVSSSYFVVKKTGIIKIKNKV